MSSDNEFFNRCARTPRRLHLGYEDHSGERNREHTSQAPPTSRALKGELPGTPKSLGFDFPKCDNVKQKTGAQKPKFNRPKKENKMKNKKVLVSAMITLLLLSVLASTALAAPPTAASGTLTYTSSTFNSIRSAGGNTIIDLSATVSYTGTFNGTSTLHGTLILHPNGTANFHDVETFTGTVNGVPGIVTFNLNGSSDAASVVSATDVIVGASGDLAGLRGVLTEAAVVLDPAVGPVGTYSGQIDLGANS